MCFMNHRIFYLVVALIAIAYSPIAVAYIGPGLGAGTIATVLGIVAGLGMLIIGVIWYPIKRLIRRFKDKL